MAPSHFSGKAVYRQSAWGGGRLYDFEEADTGGAITARVTIEFELIDPKTHKAMWNYLCSRTEPVQGKEIPEVVAPLNRNLEQGLREVESGLDSYFASHLPSESCTRTRQRIIKRVGTGRQ